MRLENMILGQLRMGEHQAKCRALNTDTAILRGSNKVLALFKSPIFLIILYTIILNVLVYVLWRSNHSILSFEIIKINPIGHWWVTR